MQHQHDSSQQRWSSDGSVSSHRRFEQLLSMKSSYFCSQTQVDRFLDVNARSHAHMCVLHNQPWRDLEFTHLFSSACRVFFWVFSVSVACEVIIQAVKPASFVFPTQGKIASLCLCACLPCLPASASEALALMTAVFIKHVLIFQHLFAKYPFSQRSESILNKN